MVYIALLDVSHTWLHISIHIGDSGHQKSITVTFLQRHPETTFISTPPVLKQLKGKVKDSQLFTQQLTGFEGKKISTQKHCHYCVKFPSCGFTKDADWNTIKIP